MARKKITFEVAGIPRGKGRPRFGKGTVYTPRQTKAYEQSVAWEAKLAIEAWKHDMGHIEVEPIPWQFFVIVTIMVNVPIPKSWSQKKRMNAIDGLLIRPGKPDIDNYLKIVCDAMNGVVYVDDAQIQQVSALKRYSPISKDFTGMIITVEEL
jgi:Holliday junction resolvase RusA-like endonuclease